MKKTQNILIFTDFQYYNVDKQYQARIEILDSEKDNRMCLFLD